MSKHHFEDRYTNFLGDGPDWSLAEFFLKAVDGKAVAATTCLATLFETAVNPAADPVTTALHVLLRSAVYTAGTRALETWFTRRAYGRRTETHLIDRDPSEKEGRSSAEVYGGSAQGMRTLYLAPNVILSIGLMLGWDSAAETVRSLAPMVPTILKTGLGALRYHNISTGKWAIVGRTADRVTQEQRAPVLQPAPIPVR